MKKKYMYKVICGYYECFADSEEDAENQFIQYVTNNEKDNFGRTWRDRIVVGFLGRVLNE